MIRRFKWSNSISHGAFWSVSLFLSLLFGLFGISSDIYAVDYSITLSSPTVEIYNMNRDNSGWSGIEHYNGNIIERIKDSSGNVENYNELLICQRPSTIVTGDTCPFEFSSLYSQDFTWFYTSSHDSQGVPTYSDNLYYDSSIFNQSKELYYYIEIGYDTGSLTTSGDCPYNYGSSSSYWNLSLVSGSCDNGIVKNIYKVSFNDDLQYSGFIDVENSRLRLNYTEGSNDYSWQYNFASGSRSQWTYEGSSGVLFYLRQIAWSYTQEDLETFLETNNTTDPEFPYGYGSDNSQNNEWAWDFINSLDPAQWSSFFTFDSNILSMFAIFPNIITWFTSLANVEPVTIDETSYNCPVNLDLVHNLFGAGIPGGSLGADLGTQALDFNQSWQDICSSDNPLIWQLNYGDPWFPNNGLSGVGLGATSIKAFAFLACLYISYIGIRGIIRSILSAVEYFMGYGSSLK